VDAWVVFAVTAAAVIAGGSVLARAADVIAGRTGLGRLWMGTIAVALVTSLPEFVTDTAAVRQGAVDLAVGDLFGSSMANMAILGAISLAFPTRRLLQSVALENVLTASLAILLTVFAAIFLTLPSHPGLGSFGLGPFLIAGGWFAGMAALREVHSRGAAAHQHAPGEGRLAPALAAFAVSAAVIFAAGPFLAESAVEIADETGVGETFFGTLALALVTSLPELAVCVTAVQMGALDLAIGNLFGSNAGNMTILVALEIAYTDGRVLESADPSQVTAALVAIALMTFGIAAIVLKAERRRLPFDVSAVAILAGYAAGMVAVYTAST
jgi:cation:H+ antiporter